MSLMLVENRTRPLLNTDLCDRCRGAATSVARNESEMELFFCDYHRRMFEDSLVSKGLSLDCETLDGRI
jgi:hypothetical protein